VQIRDWAHRVIFKHTNEGGAKERIARIMSGALDPDAHAAAVIAHCEAKGIRMGMGSGYTASGFGSFTGTETPATRCAREYLTSLPAPSDYDKSRQLWDVVWRYMRQGFYLVGGPEVPPPPEELEQIAVIIMEAVLSEIDPLRAPDPSVGARYAAIVKRAEEVIEWPRCGDFEGCIAQRDARRQELERLKQGYAGEERIVRIADYTARIVIERTRTLKVDMPTTFGEFLVEVALPAMFAGVMLVLEIWGAVVGGDPIDWSYPENVYGGAEVNEAIARAKAAYLAASNLYAEGEQTAEEIEEGVATFGRSRGQAFGGTQRPWPYGRRALWP
jgi:hypothetical protein